MPWIRDAVFGPKAYGETLDPAQLPTAQRRPRQPGVQEGGSLAGKDSTPAW